IRSTCACPLSTLRRTLSVFFFSSRRRHTRFDCDWSSDVCSSDLLHWQLSSPAEYRRGRVSLPGDRPADRPGPAGATLRACCGQRSEERRVGKECGGRWWGEEEKKKARESWGVGGGRGRVRGRRRQ